jgi:hypothetical protein
MRSRDEKKREKSGKKKDKQQRLSESSFVICHSHPPSGAVVDILDFSFVICQDFPDFAGAIEI